MFKLPVIVLGIVALLLAVAAMVAGLTPARAQDDGDAPPPAPANVRAADGTTAGAVILAWNAVDAATFYRIGWVAMDDIPRVQAEGRDWLDAFIFTDVANLSQTTYTITGLVPGRDYAFIVASVSQRFGVAAWSQWAYLTPAGVATCPDTGSPEPTPPAPSTTPPPTPLPTATLVPTATPAPTPSPTLTPTPATTPQPQPGAGNRNYDTDGDGLIEVSNLAQLAAIRADLNGDGASPAPAYAAAFPDAMAGMGCPNGCTGYELVTDLDFDTNGNGAADEGDAYWNDGAGWIPIGDEAHKFTADFDGNNHTIANLHINQSNADSVGLFGYVSGSNIRQIGLVSANISGDDSVGGLVGSSDGSTISDSYTTGSVSGDDSVGGLVGSSDGSTISDSHTTGSVSGDGGVGGLIGYSTYGTIRSSYATGSVAGAYDYVGGLVGGSQDSTITASYATGSVSGYGIVGGLVGYSAGSTISDSHAIGSASGSDDGVGGLVGHSEYDITITTSYATGSVSGGGNVGGLIGNSGYGTIRSSYATGSVAGNGGNVGGLIGHSRYATIDACYATGSVVGNGDNVGGLVGYNYGDDYGRGNVSGSYATGSVVGSGDDIGGLVGRNENGDITASYAVGRVSTSGDTFYIGGLVGYAEGGNITASYWDTQTSGHSSSYGGIGKTTAELQSPTNYTGIYANWNLDLDGDGEIDDPWHFGNATQYPALQYNGLDAAAQRQ